MRSQWLSAALDRLASLREINWLAVLGLVVSLDVAKIGFVLVWAETAGWWTPPGWLPEEVQVIGYLVAYALGVSHAIYFARMIRKGGTPSPPASPPRRRDPPRPDEPPEPRHCGIPVPPKTPPPLVARCQPRMPKSMPETKAPPAFESLPGRKRQARKRWRDAPQNPDAFRAWIRWRAFCRVYAMAGRDPQRTRFVLISMVKKGVITPDEVQLVLARLLRGEAHTVDDARRHELRRSL